MGVRNIKEMVRTMVNANKYLMKSQNSINSLFGRNFAQPLPQITKLPTIKLPNKRNHSAKNEIIEESKSIISKTLSPTRVFLMFVLFIMIGSLILSLGYSILHSNEPSVSLIIAGSIIIGAGLGILMGYSLCQHFPKGDSV